MDPAASRNCGWCVVEYKGGNPVLLAKFTQVIEHDDSGGRLEDVYQQVQVLIDTYKPSVLCMERQMGGGLAFVRSNLNEVVGVTKLCCHRNSVKVREQSPGHMKALIAGYGKAEKNYIKKNIVAAFGLDKPGPEHECDAVTCALCCLIDGGWTGYEIKVPHPKMKKMKKAKTKKG